jgi:predicted ArsR family transcriptional regulator
VKRSPTEEAPFAYAGLERIFHERGRLAVCTCLVANSDGLSFADLQAACGLTDGNLNRHLHALRELDVIDSRRIRGPHGRTQTIYRITRTGRARFLAYVDELESLVNDVHERAAATLRKASAT